MSFYGHSYIVGAFIDVEYIYGFVWWRSASKVDDVTPLPSRHKMADMCYMATLWQQQEGGYSLLWKRYDNNDVPTFRWRILHLQQYIHRLNLFHIFCLNSAALLFFWGVSKFREIWTQLANVIVYVSYRYLQFLGILWKLLIIDLRNRCYFGTSINFSMWCTFRTPPAFSAVHICTLSTL